MSSNMRNFNLCQKYSRISELIVKTMFILYAIGIWLVTSGAVYQFISSGKYVPPAMVCLTCFTEQSVLDTTIEMAFNFVMAALVFCVVSSFDSLIFVIFVNMLMVSSVITGELSDLKGAILNSSQFNFKDTKYRLRAIILMILKYNE